MKRKCDKCDRPATHHAVEVNQGQKVEKHLCDLHAAEEGLLAKPVGTPINDLLTSFVKLQAEGEDGGTDEVRCNGCGMTFAQFREKHLLGCPQCYTDFEHQLSPLLERAHEGGTHHIGKVPRRAGASDHRQMQLMRMRQRLDDAVATEDYELAARIRDDIKQLEHEV
ncbi:UvrB/UvrC motif-containing protein [Mucisphaera sp.]|uniref:UvrB/UvrC motif-containing protein n=1 Tax=Mucisphaera sp. TaxID=2913024 RepID=UPI003D14A7E5